MRLNFARLTKFTSVLFLFLVTGATSFSQTVMTRVAGSYHSACGASPCGEGGLATSALLDRPIAVELDKDDNIYIVEYGNHVVRKIDKNSGIISIVAGTMRTRCTTGNCGDGGLATSAQLNYPTALTFDAEGHLYISDGTNSAIRKVDKNTGIITTVAGTIQSHCTLNPCGDGGLATEAKLNYPYAVKFDANGNMYIADRSNHAIRKVDKNTGIITTVVGTVRIACTSPPCGDGGLATEARLNSPKGVVVASDGTIYLTDGNNHTIRKVDPVTGIITQIAGTLMTSCGTAPCGDGGPAYEAKISNPYAILLDKNNNIIFSDVSNAVIRKINLTTGIINTIAGSMRNPCTSGNCGDGGPATSAQLYFPYSIALSSTGDLYIASHSAHVVTMVNLSVLPVAMSQLIAREINGKIELNWKAYNQSNVKQYEIERSRNGYSFEKIDVVAALPDGPPELDYQWVDGKPFTENNFYRIKSIDIDGSYSYSGIVKLNTKGNSRDVNIFPNPLTGKTFQLQISNAQINSLEISLYDSKGQKVHFQQLKTQPGIMSREVNLPSRIPAGMYFIHISSEGKLLRTEKLFLKNP